MSVAPSKSELRDAALRRRSAIDDPTRLSFAERLAATGTTYVRRFAPAPKVVVAVFLPIRQEPDTLPLLRALDSAKVITALPVTPPRGEPLVFRLWRPGAALVPGRFGTMEPSDGAAAVDPDVLIIPFSAFDRRGYRLGYGGGYYDGALRRLRRAKPILALGVGFAVQEIERVPAEPHDERLDAVLTDRDLFTFGSP